VRREGLVKKRRVGDVVADLSLRAAYPLGALAKIASMDPRTLRRVLDRASVRCFESRSSVWVPLSELEMKVPVLWESIKAAETLRRFIHEEED
jgi:hypothetical protein